MHNDDIGLEAQVDGVAYFKTIKGRAGHAIFGPYQLYQPGDYAVEFILRAVEGGEYGEDGVGAIVDVVTDSGQSTLAREEIPLRHLQGGYRAAHLRFHLAEPRILEFRVEVTGREAFLIEEFRRVVPMDDGVEDYSEFLASTRFPTVPQSAFFEDHRAELRRLHEAGATVRILDGHVTVEVNGVWINARVADDLHFVGEIFWNNTYNFKTSCDCCVIDVGMNIGLATLFFAKKEFVKEVHSFEPFPKTYERALANIRLNADIASKISSYNFGLADWNDEVTIMINEDGDSGAVSIRGVEQGEEVRITVRSADSTLRPILSAAKAKGLQVVAKIDCEGSEFPIFEALEKSGLLGEVSAFMLEWHRGVGTKSQRDLILPLLKRNFVVFDLTPHEGNGFFYAVRRAP